MYLNRNVVIYSSKAIEFEISQISSNDKKRKVEDLYDALELENIPYVPEIEDRVEELQNKKIHYMDAYHIAFAESKNIDYFITVDRQLINASKNANLKLKVINPIDFMMGVI